MSLLSELFVSENINTSYLNKMMAGIFYTWEQPFYFVWLIHKK